MPIYQIATLTKISMEAEQAVGGFPLGSGLVVGDGPSELSCTYRIDIIHQPTHCEFHVSW